MGQSILDKCISSGSITEASRKTAEKGKNTIIADQITPIVNYEDRANLEVATVMMKSTITLLGVNVAIILLSPTRSEANAAQQEESVCYKDAEKMIEKFGGKIVSEHDRYNDEGNRIDKTVVSFANSKLTDDDLLSLTEALTIIYGSSPDKNSKKTKLNKLDLSFTNVTGKGFRKLNAINDLSEIELSSTLIFKEGLIELCFLDSLIVIRLNYTYVSFKAFEQLVTHYSSRDIALYLAGATVVDDESLHDVAITGSRLEKVGASRLLDTLRRLKYLRGIDLSYHKIDSKDLSRLISDYNQASLRWIDLSHNNLTNDCLQKVVGFEKLWWLNLSYNNKLTDGWIPEIDRCLILLNGLQGLKQLYLAGTGITNAGLKYLDLTLEVLDISDTNTTLGQGVLRVACSWDLFQGLWQWKTNKEENIRFPTLRVLSVKNTGVSDEQLCAISKLDNLTALDLSDTTVTLKGLEKLVESTKKLSTIDYPNRTNAIDARLQAISPKLTIKPIPLQSH